jgi:hypothetical protein
MVMEGDMSPNDCWKDKVVSWRYVGLTYIIFALVLALVVSAKLMSQSAARTSSERDYETVGSQAHKADAYSYLTKKELDLLQCPSCR